MYSGHHRDHLWTGTDQNAEGAAGAGAGEPSDGTGAEGGVGPAERGSERGDGGSGHGRRGTDRQWRDGENANQYGADTERRVRPDRPERGPECGPAAGHGVAEQPAGEAV